MKTCNRCDSKIEFERTSRGYKPLNIDGSDHFSTCKKTKNISPDRYIKDIEKKLMRGYLDQELGCVDRNFD